MSNRTFRLFEKYKVVFLRQLPMETIAQLVKGPEVFRVFDFMFRHPAHYLAPGHLALGALLNNLAALSLTEGAGDKVDILGQMGFHRFAVLLGGQVQYEISLGRQLPGQTVSPKLIQVPEAVNRQLGLRFQPVGGHAVEGPQQSVEAGEDNE